MSNQPNNEELYHQIERNLTDFKNLKITYTEFIDWTISKIQAAEKRGKREGLKRGQAIAVLFKGNEMLIEFQQAINKLKQ